MALKIGLIVWLLVIGVSADIECETEDWSFWGECYKEEDRPGGCHDVMGVVKEIDEGRRTMAMIRDEKERVFSQPVHELASPMRGQLIPCVNGMAGIYPCKNVDMLSQLTIEDLDPSGLSTLVNDMWGWIDNEGDNKNKIDDDDENSKGERLHEYAIVGTNAGTIFIRVTNPLFPDVLGKLPTASIPREGDFGLFWRDIKVIDHYAYIGSEDLDHGMQVFDLHQLRGLTADNSRIFQMSAFYDGVGNSHNIMANEKSKTIFIGGATIAPTNVPTSGGTLCGGGLHMVDVSDPLNPTFISCYGGDGYVHDAVCVIYDGPDERYHDHEICFCYNEDTLTIADVTDKHDVQIISRTQYEGYNYTHQGSFTDDFRIMLLDDEFDEFGQADQRVKTYVWNMENLEAPDLRNVHFHAIEAIDHNQYIKGSHTYQSNFQAGLRVLRLNPKNYKLKEVAYFDTYPADTVAQFGGTWSNFPYFRSGAVGVTDIESGFFLVNVRLGGDPQFEAEDDEHDKGLRHRKRARKNTDAFCAALDLEQFAECED